MRRFVLLAFALSVAACGLREPLQPAPGQSLPVAPAAAYRQPDAEALLTPLPIARPNRVDELLRRSEERQEDRFDLPPPEVPAGAVPVPIEADEPDEGPE